MYTSTLMITMLLSVTLFPAAPAKETPRDQIAKAFLQSIKSRDFHNLQMLTPTVPVWRKLSPEQTAKLSDKELKEKIEKSVVVKLRKDFNNIIEDAKMKQIDLSRLEFLEAKIAEAGDRGNAPVGLEIGYSYNGKKSSFALSVAELDGKYYLLEILRSYQVLMK
jgi:hypothetical protein